MCVSKKYFSKYTIYTHNYHLNRLFTHSPRSDRPQLLPKAPSNTAAQRAEPATVTVSPMGTLQLVEDQRGDRGHYTDWFIGILINMGVSKNRGTPKWMVYNGKPYIKIDILGVPLFFGNTHIYIYRWWLNNPFEKYARQIGNLPQFSGWK